MTQLSQRIDNLTPEKRRLLEQLMQAQKGNAGTNNTTSSIASSSSATAKSLPNAGAKAMDLRVKVASVEGDDCQSDSEQTQQSVRQFYNDVSAQLNNNAFGEFAHFLNYGYLPNEQPQSAPFEPPEHCLNRNSVKLVLELIGDSQLTGNDHLDVGCGRGGTVTVVHKYFQPNSVTGLDLSSEAIGFCQQHHKLDKVKFVEGDALKLPFKDNSFDSVSNIESSHTYPDIDAFYQGVWRVLKPGGQFLYTDVLPVEYLKDCREKLLALGFVIEADIDITSNVLLSCDEVAANRLKAFAPQTEQSDLDDFLAVPGSKLYEEMATGQCYYQLLRLRKPL